MSRKIDGIIMDVTTKQYIEFWSWDPPQKRRSAVFDDVPVRGRSEPHTFYSHTDPQVWDFSIHIIASIDGGDNGVHVQVKEKENFIESLVLPDYGIEPGDLSVIKPPHLARIRIRKMLDIVGTIRSPAWVYVGPFDGETGYPQRIDCSFSVQVQHQLGGQIDSMSSVRRLLAYGQTRQ